MKIDLFFHIKAIKEGEPLREFFSLASKGAQRHIMNEGINGFTFLHDVRKLADGWIDG